MSNIKTTLLLLIQQQVPLFQGADKRQDCPEDICEGTSLENIIEGYYCSYARQGIVTEEEAESLGQLYIKSWLDMAIPALEQIFLNCQDDKVTEEDYEDKSVAIENYSTESKVTKILGDPYKTTFDSDWSLTCEALDDEGITYVAILGFKTQEEAKNVNIGYKFQTTFLV